MAEALVVRRVVAGRRADGTSCIEQDGPTPSIRTVAARPGYVVNNIWATVAAPSPVDAPDTIATHQGVSPPRGGSVLRIIEYPPDPVDPAELARQLGGMFAGMFEDAHRLQGKDVHPGMHTTETVDYAIVLDGEITAILDDGETVLHKGDVFIQRGTNHAWSNRSGKPCRVAFVLIDGRFT